MIWWDTAHNAITALDIKDGILFRLSTSKSPSFIIRRTYKGSPMPMIALSSKHKITSSIHSKQYASAPPMMDTYMSSNIVQIGPISSSSCPHKIKEASISVVTLSPNKESHIETHTYSLSKKAWSSSPGTVMHDSDILVLYDGLDTFTQPNSTSIKALAKAHRKFARIRPSSALHSRNMKSKQAMNMLSQRLEYMKSSFVEAFDKSCAFARENMICAINLLTGKISKVVEDSLMKRLVLYEQELDTQILTPQEYALATHSKEHKILSKWYKKMLPEYYTRGRVVGKIVTLDYSSMYPSIVLEHGIDFPAKHLGISLYQDHIKHLFMKKSSGCTLSKSILVASVGIMRTRDVGFQFAFPKIYSKVVHMASEEMTGLLESVKALSTNLFSSAGDTEGWAPIIYPVSCVTDSVCLNTMYVNKSTSEYSANPEGVSEIEECIDDIIKKHSKTYVSLKRESEYRYMHIFGTNRYMALEDTSITLNSEDLQGGIRGYAGRGLSCKIYISSLSNIMKRAKSIFNMTSSKKGNTTTSSIKETLYNCIDVIDVVPFVVSPPLILSYPPGTQRAPLGNPFLLPVNLVMVSHKPEWKKVSTSKDMTHFILASAMSNSIINGTISACGMEEFLECSGESDIEYITVLHKLLSSKAPILAGDVHSLHNELREEESRCLFFDLDSADYTAPLETLSKFLVGVFVFLEGVDAFTIVEDIQSMVSLLSSKYGMEIYVPSNKPLVSLSHLCKGPVIKWDPNSLQFKMYADTSSHISKFSARIRFVKIVLGNAQKHLEIMKGVCDVDESLASIIDTAVVKGSRRNIRLPLSPKRNRDTALVPLCGDFSALASSDFLMNPRDIRSLEHIFTKATHLLEGGGYGLAFGDVNSLPYVQTGYKHLTHIDEDREIRPLYVTKPSMINVTGTTSYMSPFSGASVAISSYSGDGAQKLWSMLVKGIHIYFACPHKFLASVRYPIMRHKPYDQCSVSFTSYLCPSHAYSHYSKKQWTDFFSCLSDSHDTKSGGIDMSQYISMLDKSDTATFIRGHYHECIGSKVNTSKLYEMVTSSPDIAPVFDMGCMWSVPFMALLSYVPQDYEVNVYSVIASSGIKSPTGIMYLALDTITNDIYKRLRDIHMSRLGAFNKWDLAYIRRYLAFVITTMYIDVKTLENTSASMYDRQIKTSMDVIYVLKHLFGLIEETFV